MERKSQDGINKLSERPRVTTASSASITNPNYCGPEEEEGRGGRVQQMQCLDEGNMVIIYCNTDYLFSCSGAIRLLQVVFIQFFLFDTKMWTFTGADSGFFKNWAQMGGWGGGCKPRWALNSLHGILQYTGHLISLTGSAPWCLIVFSLWHEPKSYMFMMCHTFPQFLSLCCLLALVTCSGPDGGDFLSLPQSWRPRALLFVIVWTSLTGLSLWGVKVTGLDQMLPISWWLLVRFSFWIENSLLLYFLQSD